MTLDHIITRVRRMLDQVPFNNESVETDSDILGSISTNFSDENLTGRVNSAMRVIASRVKAQHVPQLITKYDTVTAAEANALRILPRRVFRLYDSTSDGTPDQPVRCMRRSVDANRRLQESGRKATDSYPIFTYEDGVLNIYPDTAPPEVDVEIFGVGAPQDMTWATDNATHLPVDERLEKAIIFYVCALCYQTLQNAELVEFMDQLFEEEIQPYVLETRTQIALDEQEVETE